MGRAEMLARMDSRELQGFHEMLKVHAEEAEDERHRIDSGDGQVHIYGRDDDDDGEAE